MGRGGTEGGGDAGQDEDTEESAWDSRILLSGVVIRLVEVRMLSGEVTTPGLVKWALPETEEGTGWAPEVPRMAVNSAWVSVARFR